jgi:hypothetical protein
VSGARAANVVGDKDEGAVTVAAAAAVAVAAASASSSIPAVAAAVAASDGVDGAATGAETHRDEDEDEDEDGESEGKPENCGDETWCGMRADGAAYDGECDCPITSLGDVVPEEVRTAERSIAATSGSERGRDGGNRFGRRFPRAESDGDEEAEGGATATCCAAALGAE